MRVLKTITIIAWMLLLLGCHSVTDGSQTDPGTQNFDKEGFWRYQLEKMDEVFFTPSKAKKIRIVVTVPYGGKTTVVRSTLLGKKYQVVKKVADGGIDDVSYEATAIGYASSAYESNWKAALALLEAEKADIIDEVHNLNDFAIASIETANEQGTTSVTFPYCDKNAEIVSKVSSLLLVDRELGVDLFSCPPAQ
jgi:hypothetical protein